MGKQIEFKLKEINTKESIKDGIDDETRSFKYSNDLHGVELKVKGEQNADALGLPTDTLDDSILIEFGPKQIQQKLEDDLGFNKPAMTVNPVSKKTTKKITKGSKKK
jgi:hypothetical protein